MAEFISPLNTRDDVGLNLTGLTKKQKDMAFARNPMANNQQNLQTMDETEKNRAIDSTRKGIAQAAEAQQAGMIQSTPQQTAAPQAGGPAPITGLRSNLQTMQSRLAGRISEIMSGGDISALGMEAGEPVFNPETGRWETPDTDAWEYAFNPLAREKVGQIQQLQQEISPYFRQTQIGDQTRLEARSFEDVLSQFADMDKDGELSAEEQAYLDEYFGIAQLIQRLEETNPNSAEAAAIRMQLNALDREGLVSDVMNAFDTYQRITGDRGKGAEFFGGPTDPSYNIEDIINMDTEDIEQELMQALTGQSSFFGGDFESALTSNETRSRYAKTAELETTVRNEILDAATNWASETSDTLREFNTEIGDAFRETFETRIPEYFDKIIEEKRVAGEDTTSLERAWQWFDDLYQGTGENDPGEAIMQLLSGDSGLAYDQRQILANWLGSSVGVPEGALQKGLLASTLDSLSEKGFIDVQRLDAQGRPVNVEVQFTGRDRLAILDTLNDPNMSEDQKADRINQITQNRIDEAFKDYGDINSVAKYINDGRLEQGLDKFTESLVESLNSYQGSMQADIVDEIVGTGLYSDMANAPEGADPADYVDPEKVDALNAAASQKAQTYLDQFGQATERLNKTLDQNMAAAQNDLNKSRAIEQELAKADRAAAFETRDKAVKTIWDSEAADFYTMRFEKHLERTMSRPLTDSEVQALDPYIENFQLLKFLNSQLTRKNAGAPAPLLDHIQGDNYLSATLPMKYIQDPNLYLREMSPLVKIKGANTNAGTPAEYVIRRQAGLTGADRVASRLGKIFYKDTQFKKIIDKKRQQLLEDRTRIGEAMERMGSFKYDMETAFNTFSRQLQQVSSVSPQDVADLALQMGRMAEQGDLTPEDAAQFVQFAGRGEFSKGDIESLLGERAITDTGYQRSASIGISDDYGFELSGTPIDRTFLYYREPEAVKQQSKPVGQKEPEDNPRQRPQRVEKWGGSEWHQTSPRRTYGTERGPGTDTNRVPGSITRGVV